MCYFKWYAKKGVCVCVCSYSVVIALQSLIYFEQRAFWLLCPQFPPFRFIISEKAVANTKDPSKLFLLLTSIKGLWDPIVLINNNNENDKLDTFESNTCIWILFMFKEAFYKYSSMQTTHDSRHWCTVEQILKRETISFFFFGSLVVIEADERWIPLQIMHVHSNHLRFIVGIVAHHCFVLFCFFFFSSSFRSFCHQISSGLKVSLFRDRF